jgi:hypothetical protein
MVPFEASHIDDRRSFIADGIAHPGAILCGELELRADRKPTRDLAMHARMRRRGGRPHRRCQPARLVVVRETGLMGANMLRAFQVGKALISDGEPSSWMRPSRVA